MFGKSVTVDDYNYLVRQLNNVVKNLETQNNNNNGFKNKIELLENQVTQLQLQVQLLVREKIEDDIGVLN
jgi:hypothetical protein